MTVTLCEARLGYWLAYGLRAARLVASCLPPEVARGSWVTGAGTQYIEAPGHTWRRLSLVIREKPWTQVPAPVEKYD